MWCSRCPDQIAVIAYQNQAVVYGILFRAAAETLRTIAADPQAPGSPDRLLRRPATPGDPPLGASSAPPLRRPGRGALVRLHRVNRLSAGILLAGARALAPLSPTLPGPRCKTRMQRQASFDSARRSRGRVGPIRRLSPRTLSAAARKNGVGRVCEAALRRAAAGTRLRRPLYRIGSPIFERGAFWIPKNGQVKFTWRDYRDHNQPENHDPLGRRIHPAIPAARSTERVSPHSLLRLPGQSSSPRGSSSCPGSFSTRQLRGRTLPSQPSRRTIGIGTRDSPGVSLRECPLCHRGHMIATQVLPAVHSVPIIRDTS